MCLSCEQLPHLSVVPSIQGDKPGPQVGLHIHELADWQDSVRLQKKEPGLQTPGWSVCNTVAKEGIPRHFPSQQIAPGEQEDGSTEQTAPAVSVKEAEEREQERSSCV